MQKGTIENNRDSLRASQKEILSKHRTNSKATLGWFPMQKGTIENNRDSLRASQKEVLSKHKTNSKATLGRFCILGYFAQINLAHAVKYKTRNFRFGFLLRRKRDSNPRRCDPQQFSRLPHSTTLPFLQVSHQVFPECGCKYRKLFLSIKVFLVNKSIIKTN